MIGLAGYADRFFSSEDTLATNYTAQIDVGRFLTRTLVVRGGVAGTGQFGGDDPEDRPTGSGAASLHAFGGVLFYFTPQSMVSLYSGAEYWEQLTQRGDRGTGSVMGKLGLQGAVSARTSFFIDGGYGVRLSRGDEGELLSRITGRIGLYIKF